MTIKACRKFCPKMPLTCALVPTAVSISAKFSFFTLEGPWSCPLGAMTIAPLSLQRLTVAFVPRFSHGHATTVVTCNVL